VELASFLALGCGRVRRRDFVKVIAGSAATWPLALRAQQARKVRSIGYLKPNTELSARGYIFVQGLRELGYVDGKNIIIEYRFAGGKFKRLPALAMELVRRNVDVIVAVVTQARRHVLDAEHAGIFQLEAEHPPR
jgi:putative ABC transport system substrate-binding protein